MAVADVFWLEWVSGGILQVELGDRELWSIVYLARDLSGDEVNPFYGDFVGWSTWHLWGEVGLSFWKLVRILLSIWHNIMSAACVFSP